MTLQISPCPHSSFFNRWTQEEREEEKEKGTQEEREEEKEKGVLELMSVEARELRGLQEREREKKRGGA